MFHKDDTLKKELRKRARDPSAFIDTSSVFPYKFYPPVAPPELADAERKLGFQLPPLLRDLYLQVANGGFGPGYGLLALNDKGAKNFQQGMVAWYLEAVAFEHPDYPPWPRQYLPLCDWGDEIISILDWKDVNLPVYRFNGDRYEGGAYAAVIAPEAPSFRQWLEDWLNGVSMFGRGRLSGG